jgi:hypothetical protein
MVEGDDVSDDGVVGLVSPTEGRVAGLVEHGVADLDGVFVAAAAEA